MAHFEVPGWSVPVSPAEASKKRKRRGHDEDADIHASEVNLERLVKNLKGDNDGDSHTTSQEKSKKFRVERKATSGERRTRGTGDERGKGVLMGPSKKDSVISKPFPLQRRKKRDDEIGFSSPMSSQRSLVTGSLFSGLTSLQKGMKRGLDGARFR